MKLLVSFGQAESEFVVSFGQAESKRIARATEEDAIRILDEDRIRAAVVIATHGPLNVSFSDSNTLYVNFSDAS